MSTWPPTNLYHRLLRLARCSLPSAGYKRDSLAGYSVRLFAFLYDYPCKIWDLHNAKPSRVCSVAGVRGVEKFFPGLPNGNATLICHES